ncbi:MAG TPA: copper resistance CopC family protein [Mycobacterium sp.]|nr:copper resistance CopC family protein [Mycobacterium sp.]
MKFAALLAGLVALAIAVAPTAAAHAVRIATDPVQGARLSAGPAQVSATFNEPLQTAFADMTVVGPDQHLWTTGDPHLQGAVISIALRPLGPAGRYTVNYRVTSADGHVVTGSWWFELTTPGTGTPGPAVGERSQPSGIPLWPFLVGGAVLVVAIAGWAIWRTRRG